MTSTSPDDGIRAGWRYPLYIGLVCFYALLMLLLNGACALSALFPHRERRSGAIQWLAACFARMLRTAIEWSTVGRVYCESLGKLPDEPCVIVANHTGMLDAILLLTEWPGLALVFKRQLRRSPFYRYLVTEPGFIGNDEGLALLREGCRMLGSGRSLLIFPEGTRTERVPVNAFYGGFAAVARRAGVPIQTVLIENPSWVLGKGRGFFSRYTFPFDYRYRLGERFVSEPGEDSHALTARVESYFQQNLSHLTEPPWRAHFSKISS